VGLTGKLLCWINFAWRYESRREQASTMYQYASADCPMRTNQEGLNFPLMEPSFGKRMSVTRSLYIELRHMQTTIYSNAELLILPKSAPEVLARQTASALVLSEYHVCSRCQPTTTVTTSSRECGALLNLACMDGFLMDSSCLRAFSKV
jgi:hypothetical protein